jgi:hypothetical protein
MTIASGAAWGERGPVPHGVVEVADDRSARLAVERARRAGERPPPLLLAGGDLWRTLGGRERAPAGHAWLLPADLGIAVLDGEPQCFVAHVVVRTSWWRGRIIGVLNAQFVGRWDVAPRSHPNDGRLDLVDVAAEFGVRDRWRARRRLPSGTHLPHPAITTRQVRAWSVRFEEPTPVWLDGESMGTVVDLAVEVEPDALLLVG